LAEKFGLNNLTPIKGSKQLGKQASKSTLEPGFEPESPEPLR